MFVEVSKFQGEELLKIYKFIYYILLMIKKFNIYYNGNFKNVWIIIKKLILLLKFC